MLRKCIYGRLFFSKSLMTKLTITLTLTDCHDDENNIILCVIFFNYTKIPIIS